MQGHSNKARSVLNLLGGDPSGQPVDRRALAVAPDGSLLMTAVMATVH